MLISLAGLVGSRTICCIFCTLQNLFCFHWFCSAKFISVSGCKICRVLDQALSSEQEESMPGTRSVFPEPRARLDFRAFLEFEPLFLRVGTQMCSK